MSLASRPLLTAFSRYSRAVDHVSGVHRPEADAVNVEALAARAEIGGASLAAGCGAGERGRGALSERGAGRVTQAVRPLPPLRA